MDWPDTTDKKRNYELGVARSSRSNENPKWFGGLLTRYFGGFQLNPRMPKVVAKLVPDRSSTLYHSEGKAPRRDSRKEPRSTSFHGHQTTEKRSGADGFESPKQPRFTAPRTCVVRKMMPSRSTPDLNPQKEPAKTVYSCLHDQSGLRFAPIGATDRPTRDEDSPPPTPPVRDSSSLKSVKYGPGHEKFPSWPVAAAEETPQALRNQNNGGSHRSKSWTDHTNYPKEKVVPYTRPYMKRQHSAYTQKKLKTVMEKCEKIPLETFESRFDKVNERIFLPKVDHDGKSLGDMDYAVPSPPERDTPTKPQLTQSDLEEYARSYQEPEFCEEDLKPNHGHLTESGLEEFMEYTRNYEDSLFSSMSSKHEGALLPHMHQKQISYAQSEGYHSYVSSTDSTSTPFLDRLRRDSEAVASRPASSATWEGGRDSSASSSETLKWHGSASDVSVTSQSGSARQLIVHSARVQTPQRHHSESVLYMSGEQEGGWRDRESRNNNANKLKLFALNTYTVKEGECLAGGNGSSSGNNRLSLSLQSSLSVADRISELEKQHKYSYLDPEKKHKIPDPTLKAIQKKALLSFYERHQNPTNKSAWRSEPQLAQAPPLTLPPPKSPPSRVQTPSRRASSASDYASGIPSRRSSIASSLEAASKTLPRHQHTNSCGSLAGPLTLAPPIEPDVPPARPPKNPQLRAAFPDLFRRAPSPDLPPPSPPNVTEDEVFHNDEPLPPPPPECGGGWRGDAGGRGSGGQVPEPQVQKVKGEGQLMQQIVGLPESDLRHSSVRSSIRTKSVEQIFHQVSSKPYAAPMHAENPVLGFPNQRGYQERSSARYPGKQRQPPALPPDTHRAQRASVAESPAREGPPPLQPRQMRANQSMRARVGQERRGCGARGSPDKEGLREHRSASMSHSKASYLAPRRERDRIVPDSDTGSYKRTMSPNGHALPPEPALESQRLSSRDTVWPANRTGSRTTNNNIMRHPSMKDKQKLEDTKEDLKKPLVLPDVLPVNVKLLGPRAQHYGRPTHLSLSPEVEDSCLDKVAPASPPKSPFTPLRTPSFSLPSTTSTATTSTVVTSTPTSRFSLSSTSTRNSSATLPRTNTSPTDWKVSYTPPGSPKKPCHPTPRSPRRISPPIKPSLSPNSTIKLSPIRNTSTVSSPEVTTPDSSPPLSPVKANEYPQVIEGLQLIQRTEVVLRVNASMADAASQTEKEELPPTPLPTRKKLQEEIECEKLAEDLIDHLPTSDRLKELLVPRPTHKKSTDYVHGLFRVEVTSRPRPLNSPFRSKNNTPSSTPPPTLTSVSTSTTCSMPISNITSKTSSSTNVEPTSPLSGSSAYFTTSEPKAKFLTRYSQDMTTCHITKNTKDLNEKKEELVSRLDRKLEVLRGEQVVVTDECKINDELGENVELHIDRVARPQEVAKFRLHVEEVGKITSLLLSLSGRLARAENALMGMADDHPERRILEAKRDKMLDQLEEAKKLKESIDRRSIHVSNFLYKYLNSEEYADYDHFINMKAKLIMDSKEISEKIKLGEEQLMALKETLIVSD